MSQDAAFQLRTDVEQSQTLSARQQASLRYLQMDALELGSALRHEIAANPAFEYEDTSDFPVLSDEEAREKELDESREMSEDDSNLSVNADEEVAERRQRFFDRQVQEETLQDHLIAQVALSDIAPEDHGLAIALIGDIDDDGRFKGSLPDIQMVTGASERKVVALLRRILKFDPAGCGARNLQECLLAQMDALDDNPWQDEVRRLVARHLPELGAGKVEDVMRALKVTPAEFQNVMAALRTLDPKPGRQYASASSRPEYVSPEIHAVNKDGQWVAEVDEREIPLFRFSAKFAELAKKKDATAEEKEYVRERIAAAEALVEAVEHRQETIRQIAQAIIDAQIEFFEKGDVALKPLTQAPIAQQVGVHESTVSRTVNGKYMSTPFGTRLLRDFFRAGVMTATGEVLSRTCIEDRLKALIAAEDAAHPLSDEALAKALTQEGFVVARRTVAKYRTQLNIPGARARTH